MCMQCAMSVNWNEVGFSDAPHLCWIANEQGQGAIIDVLFEVGPPQFTNEVLA